MSKLKEKANCRLASLMIRILQFEIFTSFAVPFQHNCFSFPSFQRLLIFLSVKGIFALLLLEDEQLHVFRRLAVSLKQKRQA